MNLLAPITFYALVASFFNRRIALASAAGFLFFTGSPFFPSWASATYSPALFPVIFVQSLFYISLIAYRKALYTRQRKWHVAAGILLGLTFLGHTAPAVILGGIVVLFTLKQLYSLRKQRAPSAEILRVIADLVSLLGAALVISAPYLYSIVGRYHLRILNPLPNNWRWGPLDGANVVGLIAAQLVWPPTYVALIGFVRFLSSKWLYGSNLDFVRPNKGLTPPAHSETSLDAAPQLERPSGSTEKELLSLWLMVCLLLLIYSYLQPSLEALGIRAVNITPSYHFFFYLESFKSILFGLGLMAVVEFLLKRRWKLRDETTTLLALIGISLVIAYPIYLRRDFFRARDESLAAAERTDEIKAFTWIQQNTLPTDVFLATDTLGLFVVGQSGRKVVSIPPYFSNPYVNWEAREEDRQTLFALLKAGDANGFIDLATRYHVQYVIVDGTEGIANLEMRNFLRRVFSSGGVIIYQLASGEP